MKTLWTGLVAAVHGVALLAAIVVESTIVGRR
jgi:hypothetical protein